MVDLREALNRWRAFDAVVIGDFMVDELVHGDATRLSGDAPVPILDVTSTERRPGGAANVCLNLAAMLGRVSAFGLVGADADGERLRKLLDGRGVDAAGLIADGSRPTTVKRSLIGLAQGRHPQKMFRVDIESRAPVSEAIEDRLIAALESRLTPETVVCIEDYRKGVCSPSLCARVIELARRVGSPVLVDPAPMSDYGRYRGATAITPNRTEAELATSRRTYDGASREEMAAHNAELARELLEALDLGVVVLTLDRHGALLLERGAAEAVAVPTVARETYDVTGAGDMMLAGLAAGVANGMAWPAAVALANLAAGLEVELFGVQPIPIEKIHFAAIERHAEDDPGDRLRAAEVAAIEAAALRAAGKRVVFTNGCFDVLHTGHVALLEKARALGDHLVVGLNSDASVRRLKGPDRPVTVEADRARLLGALRAVDSVVIFDEDTPMSLIEAVRPDVLVKGADYKASEVVGGDLVRSYGGRVELIDLVEGRSTTRILEKVRTV